MAKLFTTDGLTKEVYPANGKSFSLEEMQSYVGGYIEMVFIDGKTWVVNEEGKLNHLAPNVNATNESGIRERGDFFVGNVLCCVDCEVE